MSRFIGKRVSYPCGYCKKQFTLNGKSIDDSAKSGNVYYSKECYITKEEKSQFLTLRYSVETRHRPSFTASKKIISEEHAGRVVSKLKLENKREGYSKNSSFILYDKNNNVVGNYC